MYRQQRAPNTDKVVRCVTEYLPLRRIVEVPGWHQETRGGRRMSEQGATKMSAKRGGLGDMAVGGMW